MKSNIKFTQRAPIALLTALLALSPLVSLAENDDQRFCSNLDTIEDQLKDRLGDRLSEAQEKHSVFVDQYLEKKDDRIQGIKDKRSEKDATWQEKIGLLRDKAETDEQVQAIDDFVDTVEGLTEARREAVDTAITEFEEEAKELRDERGDVFSDMVDNYKLEVEATFDEAQVSCDDGGVSEDVRAELRDDLTVVRDEFKTDRQQYDFGEQFGQVRSDRVSATQTARDVFQEGFQTAKELLRTAFGG